MESVQARAVVESERAVRRSALQAVVDRAPKGVLAGKARNLLMGIARFDEMVEELGDEERMLFFLVAQVAGGGSLKDVCREYVLDYGVVWAWLMEQPKRMDAYEEAKRGAANLYVEESVGIADGADPEFVPLAKLKVDTRLKVSALLDRKRFGNDKGSGLTLNLGNNSLVSILSGMGRMEDVYVNDAGREAEQEERPVIEVPAEFKVEPVRIEDASASEDLPI